MYPALKKLIKTAKAQYIIYASFLGADYIRFNRLLDVTADQRFAHIILRPEQNREFFQQIQRIRELDFETLAASASSDARAYQGFARTNPAISIMISTDFGFYGEDAISLEEPINRCSGGIRDFGIFQSNIFPCTELLDIPIGRIILRDRRQLEEELGRSIAVESSAVYTPVFDPQKLIRLESLVNDEHYYGCIGYTIKSRNISP